MSAYRFLLRVITQFLVGCGCLVGATVVAEEPDWFVEAFAEEPPASAGQWSHTLALQLQSYEQTGLQQQSRHHASASYEPTYQYQWQEQHQFQARLFGRWDQQDSQRRHVDIREFLYQYEFEQGRLQAGIGQVFWGVSEFHNIVDVINQKDFVEDLGRSKLGQPMLGLMIQPSDWLFELYVLPGFRQRQFAGEEGRLRFPVLVDEDRAQLFHNDWHDLDVAVRGKRRWGAMELALSHFYGTSREPEFHFNFDLLSPRLLPYYREVHQTGLEWQYAPTSDWLSGSLWKAEFIYQTGGREAYWAAVGGVEYTWSSIWHSRFDWTWLVEAMSDSREGLTPNFLEHDLILGGHLNANDDADSQLLVAAIYDWQTEEKAVNLAAQRALGQSLIIKFSARWFFNRPVKPYENTLAGQVAVLVGEDLSEWQPSDDFIQQVQLLLELSELDDPESDDFQRLQEALSDFDAEQTDPALALQTIANLELLADTDHKLTLYKNDNHFQVELLYYF